jgi:hypothetical protein
MLRGQAMKKKGKEVKEEIEKQQGQGEGKMNGPDIDRHERVRPGDALRCRSVQQSSTEYSRLKF